MEPGFLFISHLFTYGELSIPGLGRLFLRKEGANRVVHEQKIYGPSFFIEFFEDTSIQSSHLSSHLKKKYHWKEKKALKKLDKIGAKIINDLLNVKASNVKHFGDFFIDKKGSYQFEVDPNLQTSIKSCYPDMDIKLITKPSSYAENSVLSVGPFDSSFEKKEKIGWFFPLLALVATSLLIACLVSCFLQKNSNKSLLAPVSSSDSSEQVVEDDLINKADSEKVHSPYYQDTIENAFDSVEDGSDYNSDDPGYYEDMDNNAYSDSFSINNDNYESPDLGDNNFDNIELLSLDHILQMSAKKRLSYNDPCMIVVGSYLRRDLLNNMVNQLHELDYDIYIEKYGRFYRTAIIYECSTKNSKTFLNKIRQDIEKAAWILNY